MSDNSTSDEMDNHSEPIMKKRKVGHNMVDGSIISVELNNFMWVGFNVENTLIYLLNIILIKILILNAFMFCFQLIYYLWTVMTS